MARGGGRLLLTGLAFAALLGGIWGMSHSEFGQQLLDPDLSAETKLASMKAFFDRFGVFSPLVYIGLVMVEVIVAPIPGAMLYAPGGVIFGAIPGGFYSLIGNVIGAGVSCRLMRWLGRERMKSFVEQRELGRLEERLRSHGVLVIFLLRVNPLTSSDLVSYASGLTSIPAWKVMLGTLLGMAPLCFVQAGLADSLLTVFPRLLYPLLGLCVVYAVIVFWIVHRMRNSSK